MLSCKVIDLGQMTLNLNKEESKVELTNKTKVLSSTSHRLLPIFIYAQSIEGVDQFIYVESVIWTAALKLISLDALTTSSVSVSPTSGSGTTHQHSGGENNPKPELATTCMSENYYIFKNKYYKKIKGIVITNP